MNVKFEHVQISNQNLIDINVAIEIPVGTILSNTIIKANSTGTVPINKDDVQNVKIIIVTESHSEYKDTMVIDLSNAGKPYQMFIKEVVAETSIGRIHGSGSFGF